MPKTGLVYHPDYLKHDTGPGHFERPARLEAIMERLRESPLFSDILMLTPHEAPIEAITRCHTPEYVEHVREVCQRGWGFLDSPDTPVSPESFHAALLAAGGVLAAVDAVMAGEITNAFCAVRPPGHHAERAQGMGFCLFNNVAIAARNLQQVHRIERVLIVDWDVHHGNATQHAFEEELEVFYFSVHQSPLYPGTGARWERGRGRGEGTTLNAPMGPGSTDEDYLKVFKDLLLPQALNFDPDFVLISAGFDAHRDDPLSATRVTDQGFENMTRIVMEIASDCCQERLVSVLEGGYDLPSLASSVERHVAALMYQSEVRSAP
jgi:acetoin utilization deacetylase AcuC-like enzyme